MQIVRTVSLPDPELLAKLQPIPENLEAVVWDMVSEPGDVAPDGIDAVVLPYLNAGAYMGALAKVKDLKFVQTQSTGYDGVAEAAGPHAAVANAAGVHAAATAELAVGLILAKLRGIDQAVRDQQLRSWRPERRRSLADRRVLLLGVGGIGHEIYRRLEPFEVTITRVGSSAREDAYGTVHSVSELAALAADHDVLVTVLPLSDSTNQLIDEKILAALPDAALVVNVGRGAVVDTDALTREVVSGRLHCALDVVDPEPLPEDHALWAASNALITPHIGGNASAFEPRIIKLLKEQLEALAKGQTPKNLVQQGPFA
ncbi:2-hydroxyacid dehydrogenase [Arthrobacter sp. M4]|uniref:2-hydroxyacid dehydrogenase n=1 Tax=Arthrobacter sp. M4 TaxID=218160 RepID=UPI001CDCD156|nr:2-hydroxyacid dehydrogenase [Arthrobacter sp. M4]MCA4133280.1 2-hydroxyacid dehydrogenase [Arthrobacter sp. M4]